MEMRFKEAAEKFLARGERLLPFSPFPRADRREAYEEVSADMRKELIRRGEAELETAYPVLFATDYMAFIRTGNRIDFEDLYFGRRYLLNTFVTAECMEGKGRFLDRIIDGIFAVCEESAWQLPAHNVYVRNAPQEILPDVTRPVLDLFACETGAQLACIYYLLKDCLDRVSPLICRRIRQELEKRILRPYLTEHFWWMGNGEEPMCNWTPWCTQNVLITAFLVDFSEADRKSVLSQAAESCDLFLKDYGDDGCCDEGAQYFRRAGLCLDAACSLMDQVTGGAFAHLYQWEKIKNIASYISNVHICGKYYFNFADCSPLAGRAGIREYLFGKHTGQPELMRFAAGDYQDAGAEIYEDETYRLSLYYRLQDAFYHDEVMNAESRTALSDSDIYYPSIGLFIARDDRFCLAVKAGDNDDNHNHNDTGSITLYKNGKPILVDIGVESYTQKTFSSRRYEIWTMQSGYHNLPSLEGLDQKDGAQYKAVDVNVKREQKLASISMELAGAYPLTQKDRSYRRCVSLDKSDSHVTLTDMTNCRNVVLNFITYEEPAVLSDSALRVGEAELSFQGASLLQTETLPITDRRLQTAWDHDLYRIRLTMTEEQFTMIIR